MLIRNNKSVTKKCYNYIAFYRIRDNEIQVVRVLYGMRNYEALL